MHRQFLSSRHEPVNFSSLFCVIFASRQPRAATAGSTKALLRSAACADGDRRRSVFESLRRTPRCANRGMYYRHSRRITVDFETTP
jgi:hypothetical protein